MGETCIWGVCFPDFHWRFPFCVNLPSSVGFITYTCVLAALSTGLWVSWGQNWYLISGISGPSLLLGILRSAWRLATFSGAPKSQRSQATQGQMNQLRGWEWGLRGDSEEWPGVCLTASLCSLLEAAVAPSRASHSSAPAVSPLTGAGCWRGPLRLCRRGDTSDPGLTGESKLLVKWLYSSGHL